MIVMKEWTVLNIIFTKKYDCVIAVVKPLYEMNKAHGLQMENKLGKSPRKFKKWGHLIQLFEKE